MRKYSLISVFYHKSTPPCDPHDYCLSGRSDSQAKFQLPKTDHITPMSAGHFDRSNPINSSKGTK